MTTEQLRAFLDAHGVPGAATEAGWSACEFKRGGIGIVFTDWHGRHSGASAGPFLTVEATTDGYAEVTRELAHTSGGFFSSDILRHAPLPDPTALEDTLAAADARAEALRRWARELEAEVDTLRGRVAGLCVCVDAGDVGCDRCGGSGAVLR